MALRIAKPVKSNIYITPYGTLLIYYGCGGHRISIGVRPKAGNLRELFTI